MSDFLLAHGMLPRRDCATCKWKLPILVDGDSWCYMFEAEPKSDYCGQYVKSAVEFISLEQGK